MIGFLLKILLVAAVIAGFGGYFILKKGGVPKDVSSLKPSFSLSSLPLDIGMVNQLKETKPGDVLAKVSSALDALVTHPGRNVGPVVLGVQVTNDSLNTLVDVLLNLPPEQVDQIKDALCK